MARFDYDVVIIGSGFGGSVAALRAAEKGYRVGVMEAGRRWNDHDIPKTNWNLAHYLWFPAAEMYGIKRLEPLDDVLVLCGAGVGGGSHVYGNTLYVPPKQFFDAPGWSGITDWADELAPCIDQARRCRLRAHCSRHAEPPRRARRGPRGAATRCQEVGDHP
jgi:cholesterol oxidase